MKSPVSSQKQLGEQGCQAFAVGEPLDCQLTMKALQVTTNYTQAGAVVNFWITTVEAVYCQRKRYWIFGRGTCKPEEWYGTSRVQAKSIAACWYHVGPVF